MVTYLDYSATTPIDPRVAEIVRHYMEVEFGNAGSRTHQMGQAAKKAVQTAREQVAAPLNIPAEDVIFTSGATEANNLAVLGMEDEGRRTGKTHIICTQIEHKAVLEPIAEMERRGFSVTRLAPEPGGWISADRVAAALRPETLLVSVMHINNETGVIQPIGDIAAALDSHHAYFHVDAAQSFCKVEGLSSSRIDLISVSGHKIYGPKGVGALGIRKRKWTRPPLRPLLFGGGQEKGFRPGTIPVMLVAGLGLAAELASSDRINRLQHCTALSSRIRSAVTSAKGTVIGDPSRQSPFTTLFALPELDSEAALLVLNQSGFALSNGAACTSHDYKLSHVLKAMLLPEHLIIGAIRLSISHLTTAAEVDQLFKALEEISLNCPFTTPETQKH